MGGPVRLDQFATETAALVQPFRSKFGALAWEELDTPGPEHEYLIDGLLTVGDKSIIGGPSRSGKSFLSIDAGMAIARGVPFFGRPVVQGLVIYQAGEGARGVKKRLRAYRKHHGIPAGERIPFVLLQSRIDLYSAEGDTAALIEECKGIAKMYDVPLRAFFIDTLATASPGADENSGKDMGAVMNNLDRIGKALPGTHVALVHHLNAAGTKLRGHSSIYANIDQVIMVTRNESTGERTAILDKQKDDEDGIHIKFKLRPVVVGYRERDQKEITSCVVYPIEGANPQPAQEGKGFALRPNEAMVYQALVNAIAEHGEPAPADRPTIPADATVVRAGRWKSAFAALDPASDESDTPELIEKRAMKALKDYGPKLVQFGLIRRENPFVWVTPKLVRGFGPRQPDPVPDQAAELSSDDIDAFIGGGT